MYKRQLCGWWQVEFALVKDPGGENPQCDDLGVAAIDLVETLLQTGTDYIEQTLAVVGGDSKQVGEIVVSVKALDALRAMKG